MTAFSSQQLIRLNRKASILEVFEYYGIKTEPDGCDERFRALCPFHTEKSPSLKIYPETNTWYAFCCAKGFSCYDFIRTQETNDTASDAIMLELAHVKNYNDPIEEVLDILSEEPDSKASQSLNQAAYLVSITLRDFLATKQNESDYVRWQKIVDDWFLKLDTLLDEENLSQQDIQAFIDTITTFIRTN